MSYPADTIDPDRNYRVTDPLIIAYLGCDNAEQARRLASRADQWRLPAFRMFGRLMIGGQELKDYVVRVRSKDIVA